MSASCSRCSGTGEIRCTNCTGGWLQSKVGVFPSYSISTTVCSVCGGTGRTRCSVCNGTKVSAPGAFASTFSSGTKCWKCNGTGRLHGDYGLSGTCDACYGRGYE